MGCSEYATFKKGAKNGMVTRLEGDVCFSYSRCGHPVILSRLRARAVWTGYPTDCSDVLDKGLIVEIMKVMSKENDRTVYQREDGQWVNKRNEGERASGVHDTQGEAATEAKEMLKSQGGGELTTMGRDGKIRSKDTIAPGNDPNPPRDSEH